MHIRSTIPEIFEKQTKNLSQTALKTEPYLRAANTMQFSFNERIGLSVESFLLAH